MNGRVTKGSVVKGGGVLSRRNRQSENKAEGKGLSPPGIEDSLKFLLFPVSLGQSSGNSGNGVSAASSVTGGGSNSPHISPLQPPETTRKVCAVVTPVFQIGKRRCHEECDLPKVTQLIFGKTRFPTQAIWPQRPCSQPLCHLPLLPQVLLVTNPGPWTGALRHEGLDSPAWDPWVRTVLPHFTIHKNTDRSRVRSTPQAPPSQILTQLVWGGAQGSALFTQ